MLPIFVIIPLGCAFLIPIASKWRKGSAQILANLAGGLLLLFSIKSIFWLKTGIKLYYLGGWKPPFGIAMALDGMTVLMLIVVNLIGCLALVYSIDYIKRYTSPALYYTLFSLLLAGLNGVVVSADLFNLFVFLEITSIASYALVAFGTEAEELEASFKYLVLGSVASILILLAIGMLLGSVSTLNMADISRSLAASSSSSKDIILYCTALFIMGFGLKTALVPFHAWLPDAHPAAPAPMSAMLSGVVIKTIGVYALCRVVFNILGFTQMISSIFIWLGIISMLVGVLLAIGQWDFKRLLAYHSISQIGYVIFGIGLGTPLGIMGGLFHLFNHSLFKSLLFLNAGSVEYSTGTRQLEKLGGLSKQMPVTSATSLIASLSIAGIPPFCGFWSKLVIIIAAFQANNIAGGVVCVLVGIITLASFLKIQKYVFIRKVEEAMAGVKEAPLYMLFSMAVLAVLCVAAGLLFLPFMDTIIKPASDALLEGLNYAGLILGT
ncbi:MAG: proton-conducting transporter membrane subunit [Candidatus Omnitrophica bacterium]|nr:proton-conducting transporter membrane subunit [Candidatus Omnitrophota bacterium]MDD5552325.1 proton-conducting transporter membrane subunit [Candidatus Omnitrophota bacterium]